MTDEMIMIRISLATLLWLVPLPFVWWTSKSRRSALNINVPIVAKKEYFIWWGAFFVLSMAVQIGIAISAALVDQDDFYIYLVWILNLVYLVPVYLLYLMIMKRLFYKPNGIKRYLFAYLIVAAIVVVKHFCNMSVQ